MSEKVTSREAIASKNEGYLKNEDNLKHEDDLENEYAPGDTISGWAALMVYISYGPVSL